MAEQSTPPIPPSKRTSSLAQWWKEEKEKISQGEVLRFFEENKGRLEKSISSINPKHWLYRATNSLFTLFSVIAGLIDKLKDWLLNIIMKIPAPAGLKRAIRAIVDEFSFKGTIDFIRAKIYAFKKAPHNVKAVQLMDDIISHATSHGLDFKKHFPDIIGKFNKRKNQLLQHSFFNEFSKSGLERFLAIPFSFNHSISPVLADTALWHKFFVFLEKKNIKDIILVSKQGQRTSLNHDSKHAIGSSEVVKTLYEASVLKAEGHRIFIIGHHEGYLGPYFVRSVLRKLSFDNLTGNCNTVVGPRMFSNLVLKNGASNVGNLFLTLPSQKTSKVQEKGLAYELMKNARRTQYLIKMPYAGLKLIEKMSYTEFMNNVVYYDEERFLEATAGLDQTEKTTLTEYMQQVRQNNAFEELDRADYQLFKNVMHEPFLLFPEGSRSYTDDENNVTMKYVNPRFMQAYLRPGDVILPVNLVGGSDITNGWKLSPATLGLSVAKPYQVTDEMIDNFEIEGINVMRTIASLPNIKNVYFDAEIQARTKQL